MARSNKSTNKNTGRTGGKAAGKKSKSAEPLKSKLTALSTKAKESKVTVVAIFAAAVVVLLAAVVITVSSSRPHTVGSVKTSSTVVITYEELSSKVRLLLFDKNVGADSLVENFTVKDGKSIYLMNINAGQSLGTLVNDVAHICKEGGLNVRIAGSRIIAEAPSYRADIDIETETETVQPPVIIETPPAPVKPTPPVTDSTKDKYGLTLPPKGNARIALLIDDCGMNLNLAERLATMKTPMAFAILPHLLYSRETADAVRKRGKIVFLHFPMEPESFPATDPGPGAVFLNMPETLIQAVTKSNVENLGRIDGANNHTGSALTSDDVKIRQTLTALSEYTNTFVDSNTSPKSVAYQVCKELGMRCGINRKFIDNENDHKYITSKLYEAAELAGKSGGIIIIGHLRPDTVTVLEEAIPRLESLGYRFVSITTFTN